MTRAFNFSAGPAMLPTSVLTQVNESLLDFQGTGMSVMEMSHRWKFFEEIHFDSLSRLRKIASIPDDFDILYMTGGASTQFALIPMNLRRSSRAGYVNTGVWSKKAIDQAEIQNMELIQVGSSHETNFDRIPDFTDCPGGLDYIHLTSNNTIYGTRIIDYPDPPADSSYVVDMSSDFLSRPIPWEKMGMVYAGLQKNAGPSGMTVVIIRKELYEREKESTPTIFRYSTFAKSDSMYNTPPTFQIYLFDLILKWIEENGGLTGMDRMNQEKAKILYDAIDARSDFYRGHSLPEFRSLMNVTFTLPDSDLEKAFVQGADSLKMWGLKGHRLVGGLRASIYNAMPIEGVKALVDYMDQFRTSQG